VPITQVRSNSWRLQPLGHHPGTDPTSPISRPPYRVPDVALVAYIPFASELVNDYALFSALPRLGLRLLFLSGNEPPPPSFAGLESFRQFIELQEFRAALALTDIQVHLDDLGRIVEVGLTTHRAMGSTPFRWNLMSLLTGIRPTAGATAYSVGHPRTDSYFLPLRLRTDWYEWWISMRLPFMLGLKANLAQVPFTGRFASSAGVRLLLRVRNDRSWTVWLSGTAVPSSRLYVNWASTSGCSPETRNCCHDMLATPLDSVRQFIFGQPWRLAPGEPRCSWPVGEPAPDNVEWTWHWEDINA